MTINKILITISLILIILLVGLSGIIYRAKKRESSSATQKQQNDKYNGAVAPTWATKQIVLWNGMNTVNILEVSKNQEFIFNNADFVAYTIALSDGTSFTLEPRSYKAFTYTTPQTLTYTSSSTPHIRGTITIR